MAALSALQSVAGAGELPYDFMFGHVAQFEVDSPALLLAGAKSLLHADASVHLEPGARAALLQASLSTAAGPSLPPAALPAARAYLAACRSLAYYLPASMSAAVAADLVELRARTPGLTEADLHRMLETARLASLSFGEAELTPERWAYAKAVEAARWERLPSAARKAGETGPVTPSRSGPRL